MNHTNAVQQFARPDANGGPSVASGINPTPGPDRPAPVVKHLQLSDGYSVPPDFFGAVLVHIQGRLPGLQNGRLYTARNLAGKVYWDQHGSGVQRLVGRCIAYMVLHHLLPLKFVEGKHEYPLRYQLK